MNLCWKQKSELQEAWGGLWEFRGTFWPIDLNLATLTEEMNGRTHGSIKKKKTLEIRTLAYLCKLKEAIIYTAYAHSNGIKYESRSII